MKDRGVQPETGTALRILDTLFDAGVRQLRLTGGEPFLHEGIFTILSHAKSKPFFIRVNTNGTLLTRDAIRELTTVVDSFLFPLHSLEPGQLAHTQELLAECADQQMEANVNTLISPDVVEHLEEYARAVAIAPGRWILQRRVPTRESADPMTAAGIARLVDELEELTQRREMRVEIHGLPLCAYDPEKVRRFSTGAQNCGVMNQLVVGPDGTVRPCYSINEPLGNVLKDDLLSMWSNGLSFDIRSHKTFPEICRRCVLLDQCLGGCRFAAALSNGSYDSLDPLALPGAYGDVLFLHPASAPRCEDERRTDAEPTCLNNPSPAPEERDSMSTVVNSSELERVLCFRDGHRYPRYVSTSDILERIVVEDPAHVPNFILSLGPCRSGTNASMRVYAEVGIRSYNQPIKGIFRHLAKGKPKDGCRWTIPKEAYLYVKETSGPFGCEECTLNPLEVVAAVLGRSLASKFSGDTLAREVRQTMREKVHVVVMGRQPFDTWYSWDEAFKNLMKGVVSEDAWYYDLPQDMRFEFFVSAYKNVERLRRLALDAGLRVTHYVAEANRNPEKAIAALFARLGLAVAPKLENWTEASALGAADSMAVLSGDHETQIRARMFDKVNQSSGIQFFEGKGHTLPPGIKNAIVSAGLPEIYSEWREGTQADLGVEIADSGRAASDNEPVSRHA
jgi:radical SAM protein with 4Fe4S-binding SPASM domain